MYYNFFLKLNFHYSAIYFQRFILDRGNKSVGTSVGIHVISKVTNRAGKCSVCGEYGYCCRNEDRDWNGDCPTGAIQATSSIRHECVVPQPGSLLLIP